MFKRGIYLQGRRDSEYPSNQRLTLALWEEGTSAKSWVSSKAPNRLTSLNSTRQRDSASQIKRAQERTDCHSRKRRFTGSNPTKAEADKSFCEYS